eukprot:TRINITY_DN18620_c0_g1_i2.p1 TRINITY_DN18620_c0_g1~~TRINITY_DN18620_c0_g1_i2.p1  ORF type:complete len:520 (+),score=-0.17 TRINITY_DN18620_c0_g1_i2:226-1785(+)
MVASEAESSGQPSLNESKTVVIRHKRRLETPTATAENSAVTDWKDKEGYDKCPVSKSDREDEDQLPIGQSALDWALNMLRWCPASDQELRSCESRLLSFIRTPHKVIQVDIGLPPAVGKSCNDNTDSANNSAWPGVWTLEESLSWGWQKAPDEDESNDRCFINTLVVGSTPAKGDCRGDREQENGKPNLVMLHGYAASLGFYFRNYDALAEYFNIYSIDQLGWGASSRPPFTPQTSEEAETWFVEALEAWRREMGLKRFVLLGHSFGGYVSSRYALKYPERVQHLILVGPAGFSHESVKMQKFRNTWKGFAFHCFWESNTTPQQFIRLLGPWSQQLVKTATMQRWSELPPEQENMPGDQVEAFCDYIYQTLSAPMSGELCFKYIFSLGAFARRPLIDSALHWKAPTTFIYGEQDIMDHRAGLAAAKQFPVPAEVFNIGDVGHMLFLEKPSIFRDAILHGCRDLLPPNCAAVSEAWQNVAPHNVPLDRCHKIHLDLTSTVLIQPQGSSGVRRLANGWGIG